MGENPEIRDGTEEAAMEPAGARRIAGDDAPEFPVETLRHIYVTPFGGFSPDLEPGEVGIHAEALARNTDLEPWRDVVTISKPHSVARIPFVLKSLFRVVPIDAGMRDAWRKTPQGEAVLPHERPGEASESVRLDLARGDELVINGVLARRLGARVGS
jgi:hypothetical protein